MLGLNCFAPMFTLIASRDLIQRLVFQSYFSELHWLVAWGSHIAAARVLVEKKINKWSFTDSSCLHYKELTWKCESDFFPLLLPLMSVCSIAFHWKNTSAYNMYACSMWCFQIQWDHTNGVFSNGRGFLLGAKHLIFEAEYALESIYIFCKKYSST